MWRPTSQSSPSRGSAYARWRMAWPWRRDLTSLPCSARPASTRSRKWYSCRARRFSAMSFSLLATRPIVGFDSSGTAAFHTRARLAGTLDAGGGWTLIPTRVGTRAREPSQGSLLRGRGRRELDLALVAADLLDSHLDRVAQPV